MKKIILLLIVCGFVNAYEKITSESIASWKNQPMPADILQNLAIMYQQTMNNGAEGSMPQLNRIRKISQEEFNVLQKALQAKYNTIDKAKQECRDSVRMALEGTGLNRETLKGIDDYLVTKIIRKVLDGVPYTDFKALLTSKGKFVATMYDFMPIDEGGIQPITDLAALFFINLFSPGFRGPERIRANIMVEIALRRTYFGSEYRKEYFLREQSGNKIDNEKNDGKVYYFYSERAEKPFFPSWVDKRAYGRGWARYIYDIVKYPALAAVAGYGALQTQPGKNAVQRAKEWYK